MNSWQTLLLIQMAQGKYLATKYDRLILWMLVQDTYVEVRV